MTDIRILQDLEIIIAEKKNHSPDTSYSAALLHAGLPKISKKVGEEAAEVIIAALVQSPEECTAEIADLMYHITVLMNLKHISWQNVAEVLEKRTKMSGLEEKSARKLHTSHE